MKSMLKVFGTVVCLAYVLVLCGVGPAFADDGVEPADTRARLEDNIVQFTTNAVPTNVRFIEIRHGITDGQPYAGTTAKYDGLKMLINVRAGRQKSEETGNSFADAVADGDAVPCYHVTERPKELNFWVEGDLEIEQNGETYTCSNFIIAQGNTLLRNNWWIAGPNAKSTIPYVGPLLQECTRSSGGGIFPPILSITPLLDGSLLPACVNEFNLSLALSSS
ncbi:MAG: hypothetical protein GDA56_13720 [Hormoscilla sp. GM7CHS1pb]|nr:hypothetical protein [Hormoscilla sp. GM7CHS1pb]